MGIKCSHSQENPEKALRSDTTPNTPAGYQREWQKND